MSTENEEEIETIYTISEVMGDPRRILPLWQIHKYKGRRLRSAQHCADIIRTTLPVKK